MLKFYDIIQYPIYSEKSTYLADSGKYVFKVSKCASKALIKKAVEEIFLVKVESVAVMNQKGKAKVFKGVKGVRQGFKKAIVTLVGGDKIDFDKVV